MDGTERSGVKNFWPERSERNLGRSGAEWSGKIWEERSENGMKRSGIKNNNFSKELAERSGVKTECI